MKEIWHDIEGFDGKYQVSNLGRVRSFAYKNERILSLQKLSGGYFGVCLSKENKRHTYLIHRLVASAFIPNPQNKKEVNHKNGKKSDNMVDNLEWATPKENMQHALQNGLLKTVIKPMLDGWQNKKEEIIKKVIQRSAGENSPNHKWTNHQIMQIRKLFREGIKVCEIARKYKVHHSTISSIVKGKAWKHLPYDKNIKDLKKKKVIRIKDGEIVEYNSIAEAVKKLSTSNNSAHSAISACCRGKRNSYLGYEWRYVL